MNVQSPINIVPRSLVSQSLPSRTIAAFTSAGKNCLASLLNPQSIAIIGATERPGSVGASVMRNLIDGGFAGAILPINPHRATVFGLPAHAEITHATGTIDLAIICTPASTVPAIVRQCGERGVHGVLILSAGFRETGKQGVALEQAIQAELQRFPETRIIGPNCVGLLVPAQNLNASFIRSGAQPGSIALLSQSGALCAAILGWAQDEGIGFSHFVSVGNMLDVGFGDLLDALADDPNAKSVVLYVEAITDSARFIEAAKRCTGRKPVIVYKAGRSAISAKAAASHTGAMAGEDAVYDAAFRECGIIRVDRFDDLLSTAELLGRGHWPRGSRLAIVTNAGGPGVIAADALITGGGTLANLSKNTMEALDAHLPACWSHGNPIDVIGDAPSERLAFALDTALQDECVDAALVIVTPQAMIDIHKAGEAVAHIARHSEKPVLAAWMGGHLARPGIDDLQHAGVPTFETPEHAIDAFLHLATHARNVSERAKAPAPESDAHAPDRARILRTAREFLHDKTGTLSETDARSLLGMYGIPTNATIVAATREAALAAARSLGCPVVLKLLSPQVTHKSDVGGVHLDLRSEDDVAHAFDAIRQSLAQHRPDAQFRGVTVQRMINCNAGVEVIVGVKRDATFGPIVLVGAGGITAEVIQDRSIGLAPVTHERAIEMIRSLRIWPLLQNYRGRAALNVDALASAIAQLSHLIADHPKLHDAETNPMLVTNDVIALDARVICSSIAE